MIATPIVAISSSGRSSRPGTAASRRSGQVFDNDGAARRCSPRSLLFVVLFVGFALSHFRHRGAGARATARPIADDSRHPDRLDRSSRRSSCSSLATFGTYELLKDGAGSGQGPNAAFLPAGRSTAMDVQVIGQQWEFTYRYPTYGGVETPHSCCRRTR